MGTKTWLAGAVMLVLMVGPSAAQNAHHYQGGPNGVGPHMMTHPTSDKPVTKKKGPKQNAHRLQGGPRSQFHSER